MIRTRILAVTAIVAATVMVGAFAMTRLTSPVFHATDLGPGVEAYDFTLTAADRGPVALSDFRGRAVLVFFGYTHCPDVCPLTMGKLRRSMELLGDRRRDVQVLLVTVDPELDNPYRMREYLQNFDLAFIGLSADEPTLRQVAAAYSVYMGEPESGNGGHGGHGGDGAHGATEGHGAHAGHRLPERLIGHSSQVFGIDPRGNWRLLWGPEATAEEIAEDVRMLLRL